MVQQLLVDTLMADGRFATAVAAPSRVPTDLLLEVELRHFEAVYASVGEPPRILVELQANLVDVRRGTARRELRLPCRGDGCKERSHRGGRRVRGCGLAGRAGRRAPRGRSLRLPTHADMMRRR